MLTGVLVYSLTGGLLLSSASEDHLHSFNLLRFETAVHLVSNLSAGVQDYTNANTHPHKVAYTSH